MLVALKTASVLLPVLYTFTFCLYLSLLFWENTTDRSLLASRSLPVLALFHLGILLLRGITFNRCPLTETFELVSFLALCVLVTHLVIERITAYQSPGAASLGVALLLQLVSSSLWNYEPAPDQAPAWWVVHLHVSFGVFGHAGFVAGATYAFIYLMLYRQIKLHRLGSLWQRLPPLERMHSMGFWACGIGLFFLSFAMATGGVVLASGAERLKPLFSTGAVWLAFAALLLLGKVSVLSGRRFAIGTITFCVLDLLGLFLTEFFHWRHLSS